MNVWVTVPSKRPAAEVEKWAQAWRSQGYKIALALDNTNHTSDPFADVVISDVAGYPGYARATNSLIRYLTERWPVDWFVIGGDDVYPDPTKRADEIAAECGSYYFDMHYERSERGDELSGCFTKPQAETFGVMQPTGDRWQEGMGGFDNAPIDRVAGSAWIGREFAKHAYDGKGPLWPEYFHMFPDEELQCYAQQLGVFWQRRDLTQRHEHWARGDGRTRDDMPAFLAEANSPEHWDKYRKLFERRKAAGFPAYEV